VGRGRPDGGHGCPDAGRGRSNVGHGRPDAGVVDGQMSFMAGFLPGKMNSRPPSP
jgi:hypothetical protein